MRSAEEVEKLLDRLESFFKEYDSNIDEYNRNSYRERNKDKLGKYEDIMKKLNGKDFDIYDESFKEYSKDFSSLDESSYIAKLTAVLDEQLKDLKDALGVSEVEVKSDENGTEIVADTEAKEDETETDENKEESETETEEAEDEEKEDEINEEELDRIAKSIKKPF